MLQEIVKNGIVVGVEDVKEKEMQENTSEQWSQFANEIDRLVVRLNLRLEGSKQDKQMVRKHLKDAACIARDITYSPAPKGS